MIAVLLFEDNKSLRQSLMGYFDSTDEITILGAYQNANEAVAKVRKHQPE
jgi:DNA-binding NarL/FixJ family response regulator